MADKLKGLGLAILLIFIVGGIEVGVIVLGGWIFAGAPPDWPLWLYPLIAFGLGMLHIAFEGFVEGGRAVLRWIRPGRGL